MVREEKEMEVMQAESTSKISQKRAKDEKGKDTTEQKGYKKRSKV